MRTRQPLRRALVASSAWSRLGEELRAQVCEELNIGSLESLAEAGGDLVDHSAKGNFRSLGKRFAQDTPKVAAAIAAADAGALAESLASTGSAVVVVDGESVEVGPDDVIIAERPREGWSVVNDQGETVALDLELDDELRRAGLAREIVRAVQEARKASGLEITDRIEPALDRRRRRRRGAARARRRDRRRGAGDQRHRGCDRRSITATTSSGCASRSRRPDNAKEPPPVGDGSPRLCSVLDGTRVLVAEQRPETTR